MNALPCLFEIANRLMQARLLFPHKAAERIQPDGALEFGSGPPAALDQRLGAVGRA